jgi:hypothetical protein
MLRLAKVDLAEEAIAALLAGQSPHEISETRITELLHSYGAIGSHARAVGLRVFRRALTQFLDDHALTDEELNYLDRLCRLLDIAVDDVEQVKADLVHPWFVSAARLALADGVLEQDERAWLDRLQVGLRLPAHIARTLLAGPAREAALTRLAEMVADRRLSPDELESVARLEDDLGATVTLPPEVQRELRRYADLWRIENGDLPEIPVPLNLMRGEICHFMGYGEWWELRTRTTRITYGGPIATVRIAKGLRYRIGSIAPHRMTKEEMTHIDSGPIYFTSKRVLFRGAKKNAAIRFTALVGLQAYSDAIMLEKATGRSPHILLPGEDVERAAVILTTAMGRD